MSGYKHDTGKVRMDLISPRALLEMGGVLALGAEEYGDYNWRKVSPARHYAAAQRHLNKFWSGKILDKSGYHHLIHAITDLMFVYELDDNKGYRPIQIGLDTLRSKPKLHSGGGEP